MLSFDVRYLAGGAVSIALLSASIWIILRRRLTPAERERRRRIEVNRNQRTAEATISEANENLIQYSYELRGVAYSASQDVSTLGALLPEDPSRLIGPVSVKYDPRNPANSIVLCEAWSGLNVRKEIIDAVLD